MTLRKQDGELIVNATEAASSRHAASESLLDNEMRPVTGPPFDG
jgi:hypothetical protein